MSNDHAPLSTIKRSDCDCHKKALGGLSFSNADELIQRINGNLRENQTESFMADFWKVRI
jgi:hypothetical protein